MSDFSKTFPRAISRFATSKSGAWTACAFAGLATFGLGWATHRLRNQSSIAEGNNPRETKFASAPGRDALQFSPTPASAAESLVADDEVFARRLAASSGVERWLLLCDAAERSTATDMPSLMNHCGNDPAAMKMVAARWIELDPQHMWLALLSEARNGTNWQTDGSAYGSSVSTLAEMLLKSWVKTDPAAARAALGDDTKTGVLARLRPIVIGLFLNQDVESALPLLKEWSIHNVLPDLTPVDAWARKNPAHAASVAKDCGTGMGALLAMERIGKIWAESDPAAALAFAGTLPPQQREKLAQSTLASWAEKNVVAAAAYVATQADPTRRAELGASLVKTWVKNDPEAAVIWAEEHLPGEARVNAVSAAVESLAAQDLQRAVQFVGGLQSPGVKNKSALGLINNSSNGSDSAALAEWIATVPEAGIRRSAFDQLGYRWEYVEPGGPAKFLTGPHASLASDLFVITTASSEARRDPAAAMAWVEKISPVHTEQARSTVFNEWLRLRPEAATDWIFAQPADESRARLVGSMVRTFGIPRSEIAEPFFTKLPAQEREAASVALAERSEPEAAALLSRLTGQKPK